MTKESINYIDTLFEHRELTKIHGEPTYETLQIIANELKTNAATVRTHLGGGNHGHLGLVLPPVRYALISPTPFKRPTHPGAYEPPAGGTGAQIAAAKEAHEETTRVFYECLSVEAALRKQIVQAVESKYLKVIRNQHTNAITMTVSDILYTHLFPSYGLVTAEKLMQEQRAVEDYMYDPRDPITDVYTAIDDLLDLADTAGSPFTQAQALKMGFEIIKRTGMFTDGLKQWISRPANQRTWTNFKVAMTTERDNLKKLGSLELQQTMNYQQANVMQQMVFAAIQEAVNEGTLVPTDTHHESEEQTQQEHPSQQQANAAMQDPTISIMMKQMQSMQEQIMKMMEMQMKMSTNGGSNNNGGQYKHPYQPPKDKKAWKYCWTHGYCHHDGATCTRKAQGHKDNATLQDPKGGNLKGQQRYEKTRNN